MKFKQPTQRELDLLPFLENGKIARAKHRTARAVIQAAGKEVRIPFVARDQRGDFKRLMNRMTETLGHSRYRFVAVDRDPEMTKIWRILAPKDARELKDVLRGFREETIEEYENDAGVIEPVATLVGDWNPEKYQ